MTLQIGNCGHDERNQYSGGQAGDQGGEFVRKDWYSRPWKCVIRLTSAKERFCFAALYAEAADNDEVGYDQGQRLTYYNELMKAKNHRPKNITTACETDCSASVAATLIATGKICGDKELADLDPSMTTYDMRSKLKATGKVKILTDSKYLTSTSYLKEGDILLNDDCHVAVSLGKGSKASYSKMVYLTRYPLRTLPKHTSSYGSKRSLKRVKKTQKFLNWAVSAKLTVDGVYGDSTRKAVKQYKEKAKIGNVNGKKFGRKCIKSMKTFKK